MIPVLYAFSRHIVPATDDTNSHTTGYWFLDEPYTPPDELVNFLNEGDPPIYFGFGSMTNSSPSETFDMISDVLDRVNRRGIIVQGWSDMQIDRKDDRILLLKGASHTWLFPRVAAVVHHGGAGTTAAGLSAGRSGVIIPHIADQPFWARRLYELGLTLKPLHRHKISVPSLVERLETVLHDQTLQRNVRHVADMIQQEDGISSAVNWIEEYCTQHAIR